MADGPRSRYRAGRRHVEHALQRPGGAAAQGQHPQHPGEAPGASRSRRWLHARGEAAGMGCGVALGDPGVMEVGQEQFGHRVHRGPFLSGLGHPVLFDLDDRDQGWASTSGTRSVVGPRLCVFAGLDPLRRAIRLYGPAGRPSPDRETGIGGGDDDRPMRSRWRPVVGRCGPAPPGARASEPAP